MATGRDAGEQAGLTCADVVFAFDVQRHLNGDAQRLSLANSFLPLEPPQPPVDTAPPAPTSATTTATTASEAACPLQDRTGRALSDVNTCAEAQPVQAEKGGLANGVHTGLNNGDHKLTNGHAELMTL